MWIFHLAYSLKQKSQPMRRFEECGNYDADPYLRLVASSMRRLFLQQIMANIIRHSYSIPSSLHMHKFETRAPSARQLKFDVWAQSSNHICSSWCLIWIGIIIDRLYPMFMQNLKPPGGSATSCWFQAAPMPKRLKWRQRWGHSSATVSEFLE